MVSSVAFRSPGQKPEGVIVLGGTVNILGGGSGTIVRVLSVGTIDRLESVGTIGRVNDVAGTIEISNIVGGTIFVHGTVDTYNPGGFGTVLVSNIGAVAGTVEVSNVSGGSLGYVGVLGTLNNIPGVQGTVLVSNIGNVAGTVEVSNLTGAYLGAVGTVNTFGPLQGTVFVSNIGAVAGTVAAVPYDSSGNELVYLMRIAMVPMAQSGGVLYDATTYNAAGVGVNCMINGYPSGANAIHLQGNIAHDAADSGNPLRIGGRAGTQIPAAVASGDRTNAWFDTNGRQAVFERYSFSHLRAVATTTVKTGVGGLHTVVINDPGSNSTVSLYDNTSAAGTVIASYGTLAGRDEFTYDLQFVNGLTVIIAGGTAADLTITYA